MFRDKYGIEFQVVDMRWGGRDEATDDHMTTTGPKLTELSLVSLANRFLAKNKWDTQHSTFLD